MPGKPDGVRSSQTSHREMEPTTKGAVTQNHGGPSFHAFAHCSVSQYIYRYLLCAGAR